MMHVAAHIYRPEDLIGFLQFFGPKFISMFNKIHKSDFKKAVIYVAAEIWMNTNELFCLVVETHFVSELNKLSNFFFFTVFSSVHQNISGFRFELFHD